MPSKEEIEKAKQCLQEMIQNTYAEGKAIKLNNLLEYIDQLEKTISRKMSNNKRLSRKYLKERCKNKKLESDKQKLIEKLVEDKIELTEELKYNTTKRESRIQLKLVDKYLEILKGEVK